MNLPRPSLLLVTDRKQARAPLEDILASAFAAGCRWASLREKDLSESEQVVLARALHTVARQYGARLTLHGSAEAAKAAGVDGVHLPGGADPVAARSLLGASALIGISVHAPSEAARVPAGTVDYVVAGPAFETASKPGYGPALAEAGIAAIASVTPLPLIAIGGIEPDNMGGILRAGAAGVAVMGGVMRAANPGEAIRDLLSKL